MSARLTAIFTFFILIIMIANVYRDNAILRSLGLKDQQKVVVLPSDIKLTITPAATSTPSASPTLLRKSVLSPTPSVTIKK
jgi:hypothetical protein